MPIDPILLAFSELAAGRPREPLVASPSRSVSAEALAAAAESLERRLAASGVGPGSAVGLAAAAGPALLVGYLALRRRGAVPVLCDSARPTPDRLAALDRLGVTGFVASADGWPSSSDAWEVDRRDPERPLAANPDWGAIKLSSGSTGEPRGIAVTSAALLADDAHLTSSMGLRATDRFVAKVPLSHSYGFSSLALPALVRGSLLVVPEGRSPLAPLAAARALGATVFPTVPAWLGAFVRLSTPPPWPESVRLVLAAGAPLPAETAAAFRAATGRAVHVFYGASECGGITYDRRGDAAERGTVGTAVDGVALRIDPATGRLEVRSAAVASTYLPEARPELGSGRFLTGDLAELGDGEVRLSGRADDIVFVRGKNVNPREVEAALREIPGVVEASVLGVDGPDGPRSVLRAVVAAPGSGEGSGPDYETILAHCRRRLAEHKVPRSVVVVAEMPRTDRGKLDREMLASLVQPVARRATP
jgi:long-chain acyl-CoA synthetase